MTRNVPTGPLEPGLAWEILDAVAGGFSDQIQFTEEMMRYPSLRGQEHTAQTYFYDALASRGYAMDRWAIDVADIEDHPGFSPVKVDYSNAINVVGTHKPTTIQGRSLIQNGHVDLSLIHI